MTGKTPLLLHRREPDIAVIDGNAHDGNSRQALGVLGDGGEVDDGATGGVGFDEAGGEALQDEGGDEVGGEVHRGAGVHLEDHAVVLHVHDLEARREVHVLFPEEGDVHLAGIGNVDVVGRLRGHGDVPAALLADDARDVRYGDCDDRLGRSRGCCRCRVSSLARNLARTLPGLLHPFPDDRVIFLIRM